MNTGTVFKKNPTFKKKKNTKIIQETRVLQNPFYLLKQNIKNLQY